MFKTNPTLKHLNREELRSQYLNVKEMVKGWAEERRAWKRKRNSAQASMDYEAVSINQRFLNNNLPLLQEAEENKKVLKAELTERYKMNRHHAEISVAGTM